MSGDSQPDAATRNMAVMAQMRLDALNRPHDIRPFQAGDELLVCGGCGFALEGGEHSRAEILRMYELVAAHDGAKAVGPDPDRWIERSRGRGDQADN